MSVQGSGQFTRNGQYGVSSAQNISDTYAPADFAPAGSGAAAVPIHSNYQQPQQQMSQQRVAQQSNPQLAHQDQRSGNPKILSSSEEANKSTMHMCEALYRGFLDGQKLNQESNRDLMNAAINMMHVAANLMNLQIRKDETTKLQLFGQLLAPQNMQYSPGEGSDFCDQPMNQPTNQPMNPSLNPGRL